MIGSARFGDTGRLPASERKPAHMRRLPTHPKPRNSVIFRKPLALMSGRTSIDCRGDGSIGRGGRGCR